MYIQSPLVNMGVLRLILLKLLVCCDLFIGTKYRMVHCILVTQYGTPCVFVNRIFVGVSLHCLDTIFDVELMVVADEW